MSLREEIYNLTLAYGEYVNDWEREQMTDKILNLFEKRIDATIEDIKRDIEFVSKHNLKDDKSNSVQLHHIYKLKEVLK